jgi:hypothetical protein
MINVELFPPNPKEFERIFLTSRPLITFVKGAMLSSFMGVSKRRLGNKMPWLIDITEITASTAPAAPRV